MVDHRLSLSGDRTVGSKRSGNEDAEAHKRIRSCPQNTEISGEAPSLRWLRAD